MRENLPLLALLAALVVGPLLLRPSSQRSPRSSTAETVSIITPHNEAMRYEFGRAFAEHHRRATGRRIVVDWRTPGGTSEITRYIASEYVASFQNLWSRRSRRPWTEEIETGFHNPKLNVDETPLDDTPAEAARRAFLASDASCGLDVFFGGGTYDFSAQAAAGHLVDCGVVKARPELFSPAAIPQSLGGEPYWDPQGRWIGTCLSAFGICYNIDRLRQLAEGGGRPAAAPAQWGDLADPRYFGEVALANPGQSSSVNKAFEMLIQQQMLDRVRVPGADERTAVIEGWDAAMHVIQRIGANARYFSDASTKIPLDVGLGDATVGMSIDFLGRFQSEAVRKADGTSRIQFVIPAGGSSVGVDPIGLLRGAPNPALAREFIEFVLSMEGQKLWNFKAGVPDGPAKYALRRLPIRPDFYRSEWREFRSDPDVLPYEQANAFVYHAAWTAALFRPLGFIIRVLCIDTHDELRAAWQALIAAGFPAQATALFNDLSSIGYEEAKGRIAKATAAAEKIEEVKLAKEMSDRFRIQYRTVTDLAREGR